jgi:hypothetical protein
MFERVLIERMKTGIVLLVLRCRTKRQEKTLMSLLLLLLVTVLQHIESNTLLLDMATLFRCQQVHNYFESCCLPHSLPVDCE